MEESFTELEQDLDSAESEPLRFPSPSKKDLGWILVGGGAVGTIIALMRRRSDVTDWIVPLSLIGLGTGVLLQRRQSQMHEAEASILAELDSLDPIARAQVMKAVAKDQIGRLPGVGD